MAKASSSHRWLQRQGKDPYVKQARADGYRSRAAFKLLEIDERDKLLRPGATVIDLGAAPGGWSQVAAGAVGRQGRVIAMDILAMQPLANVTILQGDFTRPDGLEPLLEAIGDTGADLVFSDMAPNIVGIPVVDQARTLELVEQVLEFARQVLKPKGSLLVKLFKGEGFDAFMREMRAAYRVVYTRKPKASRAHSREVYILGRYTKG